MQQAWNLKNICILQVMHYINQSKYIGKTCHVYLYFSFIALKFNVMGRLAITPIRTKCTFTI